MKSRLVLILAAWSLASCQPADINPETIKQRLDRGEVVEMSDGYLYPSCRNEWTEVRVNSEKLREEFVLRRKTVDLDTGFRPCYRSGNVVPLQTRDKSGPEAGLVRVNLALVRAEFLDKALNQYKVAEEVGSAAETVKSRLQERDKGIVSVIRYSYLRGSAADEKEIRQKDQENGGGAEKPEGDQYVETKKDGDALFAPDSKCAQELWTSTNVPEEFRQAILDGKLQTFYNRAKEPCLRQGQELELAVSGTAFAKIRITKVKRFIASYLDAKYFSMKDFDFAPLEALIKMEVKPEFTVTLYDFELVTGQSEPAHVVMPMSTEQPECLPTTGLSGERVSADEKNGDTVRFQVRIEGRACLNTGDQLLLTVQEGEESRKFAVTVVEAKFDEASGTTSLTVDRLGFVTESIGTEGAKL